MKKILLFVILVSASASADLLPPKPGPKKNVEDLRIVSEWESQPTVIVSTNSCQNTLLCVGNYVQYAVSNSAHTKSQVGRGIAYCNTKSKTSCPSARDCIADNDLKVNQGVDVLKGGDMSGGAVRDSGSSAGEVLKN